MKTKSATKKTLLGLITILSKVLRFKTEYLLLIIENQHLIVIHFRLHDRTWWQDETVLITLSAIQENVLIFLVEEELLLKLALIRETVILEWHVSPTKPFLIKALAKSIWRKESTAWVIMNVHSIWFAGLWRKLILGLILNKEDACNELITMILLNLDGFLNIDMIATISKQMGKYAKVDLLIKSQTQLILLFTLIWLFVLKSRMSIQTKVKWQQHLLVLLLELEQPVTTFSVTFTLMFICSVLANVV